MTARSRAPSLKSRLITGGMWVGLIGVLAATAWYVVSHGAKPAAKNDKKGDAKVAEASADEKAVADETGTAADAAKEATANAADASDAADATSATPAPADGDGGEPEAEPAAPEKEKKADDAEPAIAPTDFAHAGARPVPSDAADDDERSDDAAGPAKTRPATPKAPAKPTESLQKRLRRERAKKASALLARLPPVAGPAVGDAGAPGSWAGGLVCEMFAGSAMKRRVLTRVTDDISFDPDGPLPVLGEKLKSNNLRWSGYLLVPFDGSYEFAVQGTSNVAFTMDNKLVEDASSVQQRGRVWGRGRVGSGYRADALNLRAGLHPIVVVMTDAYGGYRGIEMVWSPPGASRRSGIPGEYLCHTVPEPDGELPERALAPGLRAEVFADAFFRRPLVAYAASTAQFDFGNGAPVTSCRGHGFSLRLSGHLLAPAADTFAFQVDSPHPCKMLIDGETVVERSAKNSDEPGTGEVDLSTGYHEFAFEYVPRSRPAKARVRWKYGATRGRLVDVPTSSLFHEASAPTVVAGAAGTTPGLECAYFKGERLGGPIAARGFDTGAGVDLARLHPPGVERNGFSVLWKGVLIVPKRGVYTFQAQRRGGAALMIGGAAVISDWRPNEETEKGQMTLREGLVPVQIRYFNRTGNPLLSISWSGPDFPMRPFGGAMLVRKTAEFALAEPWGGHARDDEKRVADIEKRMAAFEQESVEPREPLPEGNLVANAGFEKPDDKRFAAGWRKYGTGSMRIDPGNAHGGDVAVAVRAAPGATAGAYTTLKLPAAKYTIKMWACADVDKRAEVFAHVGGVDCAPQVVGEDWAELTFTATVPKSHLNASFRVCTAAEGVRVWFDDVSLEATGHVPKVKKAD